MMFGSFPENLLAQFKQDYAERMEQSFADKEKMKCNKPQRTPDHPEKKSIVKACDGGKEKLVRFGDQDMKIKKNIPSRRKSFRARHNCADKKDKMSAGYWSCKAW